MRLNLQILLLAAAVASAADPSPSAYRLSLEKWRAQQETELKAENGWLTVVGLHWLKEGENRVGSTSAFEVPLPESAPKNVGVITLHGDKARFKPSPGTSLALNSGPAKETELKPDTDPHRDVLVIGKVSFFLISRGDRLGVRVRDNNSASRRDFAGLSWYPIDASWKVPAEFVPWDKPHALTFDTAVGVKERDESPGYVRFQVRGKEYRLEPVVEDQQLWFVMRDLTSGKTTYAASRFLYADLPKNGIQKRGPVELDFNRAENPPCVFTDFATCPLPPPQNRLPLAVTAGERMYSQHR